MIWQLYLVFIEECYESSALFVSSLEFAAV